MVHCPTCEKTFKNKKIMKEHREAEYLGYRYACGTCGLYGMKRSNLVSAHRNSQKHVACKKAASLQFRPGIGFFFDNRPVVRQNLPTALW